jgi:hypothetical protein
MALRFRISLKGIKGFTRLYEVRPDMTLYDFHKVLRDELDFPHDQQILFKAFDNAGNVVARYGIFDLGAGTLDTVTLQQTVDNKITSFVYFYDVIDRKSVIITYEGEAEDVEGKVYPALVETKGPNPVEFENGYVAYEDLPDDQKHLPSESSWEKDIKDADDSKDEVPDEEDDADDEEDSVTDDDSSDSDDEENPLDNGKDYFDGSEDLI